MNLTKIDIPEDIHTLIFRYVYDFIIKDLKVLFKSKQKYKILLNELYVETYAIRFKLNFYSNFYKRYVVPMKLNVY